MTHHAALRFLRALPILLLATAALAAPATAAGYDRFDVKASHRAGLIAASLWYPPGGGGNPGLIGDNVVIEGVPASVGAKVSAGAHPLIVLSHGSGGNMDGLAWLSSALADKGVMVLAVNHPGSTSGDSSARRSVDLASREADLSAALDTLLADPAFGPHVDRTRITAAGFSLGGATALNLGGLIADASAFAGYCRRITGPHDCSWFEQGGVDLAHLPPGFSATKADPRISSVIAVDPGPGDTYTNASIAAFQKPLLFINLGEADRWPAVDVGPNGSNLVGLIPGADYAVVAPAWHFSFLGLCKPGAQAMLLADKDDPICDDPAGSDRAAVHQRIIDAILAFVDKH